MEGEEEAPAIELEKTIELRAPIVIGSLTYTELKLREPVADEIDKYIARQAKAEGIGPMYLLIASVSGMPEAAVRKLPSTQVKEAIKFLVPFLDLGGVFPATGGKSSPS